MIIFLNLLPLNMFYNIKKVVSQWESKINFTKILWVSA